VEAEQEVMSKVEVRNHMYIGKRIVVGLTIVSSENAIIEQRQIAGVISQCSPSTGIVISSERGASEDVCLPYCTDAIVAAPPGTYTLSSLGVEVKNPDFMTSWIFRQDEDGNWHSKPDPMMKPA